MNRTPPKEVQEQLRKEVNFGCPVPECGVPYLTWHHFDPRWSEKEHHNPEGMIALCANHASLADGGRWTKAQLRRMKKKPYVPLEKISEYYDYLRKDVVCIVGNVAYNVKDVLEIYGERVIGFERDSEGYSRLNLLVRDKRGISILVMKDNFWTAISKDLFDLRCSLRGKELEIVSKDKQTNLCMKFDDYPLEKFKQYLSELHLKSISRLELYTGLNKRNTQARREELSSDSSSIEEFISYIGSPETVPTWTIKGRLLWGNVHLDISDFGIENLTNHFLFGMNFVFGGETAFGFQDDSTVFGIA